MRSPASLTAAAVFCLLAFALGAAPAEAQTASFEGSTLGFSKNGDFRDAGSTCPGGAAPTQFRWTFNEDAVIKFGNPVTFQFAPGFCANTVTLRITCPGGATASSTRAVCWGCCVPGGIRPDVGYN